MALRRLVFQKGKLRIEGFRVEQAGNVAVLEEVDRVQVAQARANHLRRNKLRGVAEQNMVSHMSHATSNAPPARH